MMMQTRVQLPRSVAYGTPSRRPFIAHVQHRSRAVLKVQAIKVGDKLPAFELYSDTRDKVRSADLVKDKGLVIFVYPKANTSGCTVQASAFRDSLAEFEGSGYGVVGLSADSPEALASWKAEYKLTYPLLSDPAYQVLTKLGVATGRTITRSHIVVEKGGVIKSLDIGVKSAESMPNALKLVKNVSA